MSGELDEFLELIGELTFAEVDSVVIGALAVNYHGVVRGTEDVDLVPDPDPRNLARLRAALSSEAHEPPIPERFAVPEPTARLVNSAREAGHRVIEASHLRLLEAALGPRPPRQLLRGRHRPRLPLARVRRQPVGVAVARPRVPLLHLRGDPNSIDDFAIGRRTLNEFPDSVRCSH